MSQQLAKRPSVDLGHLREGDRIRWRMPFVGSVVEGTVSHVNCTSFTIRWDLGESGSFDYSNKLVWNIRRIA